MSKKLYVIARAGREIPHYGTRHYGEFWDNLPDNVVNELKDHPDFSLSNPGKTDKAKAESEPEKQERRFSRNRKENEEITDGS